MFGEVRRGVTLCVRPGKPLKKSLDLPLIKTTTSHNCLPLTMCKMLRMGILHWYLKHRH